MIALINEFRALYNLDRPYIYAAVVTAVRVTANYEHKPVKLKTSHCYPLQIFL